MDHLFYLTDVNGPRLTASPGSARRGRVGDRARSRAGASRARAASRGGASAAAGSSSASPRTSSRRPTRRCTAIPLAWSGGTAARSRPTWCSRRSSSATRTTCARIPPGSRRACANTRAQQRGKLAGRVVLIEPLRELPAATAAALHALRRRRARRAGGGARARAAAAARVAAHEACPTDPKERQRLLASLPLEVDEDYWTRQTRAWDPLWALPARRRACSPCSRTTHTGATRAASCSPSRPGSGARARRCRRRWWCWPPESYGRIARLVAAASSPCGSSSRSRSRCRRGRRTAATWWPRSPAAAKKDEVVMLGAHLDSWHAGTGATDNAAGCAVVLEAMRILKALDAAAGPHRAPRAVDAARSRGSRLARLREEPLRRSGRR